MLNLVKGSSSEWAAGGCVSRVLLWLYVVSVKLCVMPELLITHSSPVQRMQREWKTGWVAFHMESNHFSLSRVGRSTIVSQGAIRSIHLLSWHQHILLLLLFAQVEQDIQFFFFFTTSLNLSKWTTPHRHPCFAIKDTSVHIWVMFLPHDVGRWHLDLFVYSVHWLRVWPILRNL